MNTVQLYKATFARTGAKVSDMIKKPFNFGREYRKEKTRIFCNDYGLLHDDVLYNDYDPVCWEALQRINPAHFEMRVRRWLRAIDLNQKNKTMPISMHNTQGGDPLDPNLMYLRDEYFKVKAEFKERERFEDSFI
jgi:hypothetical protein